jgi:hypothetical protein
MGFKVHTCTSINCDHCGKTLFDDDTYGTVHFVDEKEALDLATTTYEWKRVGRQVFCADDDCAIAAIDAEAALPPAIPVIPGQMSIGGEG